MLLDTLRKHKNKIFLVVFCLIVLIILFEIITMRLPGRQLSSTDIKILSLEYVPSAVLNDAPLKDLCFKCNKENQCFFFDIMLIRYNLEYPKPAACVFYLNGQDQFHESEYYPVPFVKDMPSDYSFHAYVNIDNNVTLCCTSASTPSPVCTTKVLKAACPSAGKK